MTDENRRGRCSGAKNRSWEDWYADAREYYRAYGDLLIPSRYETPEGYKLGRWIERQRALYNGTQKIQGVLTRVQIRELEKIGMVWKLENRFSWEIWLAALIRYRAKYGDLCVPSDYRDGDLNLGNWVREQRKRRRQGTMTEQQIRELDALGMVWSRGFKRAWQDWYADAKRYYEEHGDLLVPYSYLTPEGYKLGVWIFGERERFAGRPGKRPMTQEECDLLNKIGMVWRIRSKKRNL